MEEFLPEHILRISAVQAPNAESEEISAKIEQKVIRDITGSGGQISSKVQAELESFHTTLEAATRSVQMALNTAAARTVSDLGNTSKVVTETTNTLNQQVKQLRNLENTLNPEISALENRGSHLKIQLDLACNRLITDKYPLKITIFDRNEAEITVSVQNTRFYTIENVQLVIIINENPTFYGELFNITGSKTKQIVLKCGEIAGKPKMEVVAQVRTRPLSFPLHL